MAGMPWLVLKRSFVAAICVAFPGLVANLKSVSSFRSRAAYPKSKIPTTLGFRKIHTTRMAAENYRPETRGADENLDHQEIVHVFLR